MSHADETVRFVPSRTEGLPEVSEVVVHRDRLEVNTAGRWVDYPFARIARRQEPAFKSFFKRALGMRCWPSLVGERDWFHPPRDRFFIWYTDPPLKTCMPETEGADHNSSLFPRIDGVLAAGGFATMDLG